MIFVTIIVLRQRIMDYGLFRHRPSCHSSHMRYHTRPLEPSSSKLRENDQHVSETMRITFKRRLARLQCRLWGHQLHFVRADERNERLFYCQRCKDRFVLSGQCWHRTSTSTSDTALRHSH